MTVRVGSVTTILEQAGQRHLWPGELSAFRLFLFHIDDLRWYEPTPSYWVRVQRLIDGFFLDPAARLEVCQDLIQKLELTERYEAYDFVAETTAEKQLQELLEGLAPLVSAPLRQTPIEGPHGR